MGDMGAKWIKDQGGVLHKEKQSDSARPKQGPLAGIHILDLTRYQNGPSATRRLADLGADVIKVEHPSGGDPGRGLVFSKDGFDLFFEAFNRGKRSICLDLRDEASRPIMHRLAKWADVLAENFRPGVLSAWGYGYEVLRKVNPALVYASNSGFGPTGEWAGEGAFDLITQAYSGAMVSQGGGPSHTPMAAEWALADEVGAMNFTTAILAAIVARGTNGGEGQLLETSQLGAMITFQAGGWNNMARVLHDGTLRDDGKAPYTRTPMQGSYECSDGKWLVINPSKWWQWEALCRTIGREVQNL
jgi:formyl-CoA transferase